MTDKQLILYALCNDCESRMIEARNRPLIQDFIATCVIIALTLVILSIIG